ncbi:MAG: hypothetical protein JXQ75_02510 [Phycisphaerae bacterium]|nr:hypothetical protein [Phycisphaerae bacterium]
MLDKRTLLIMTTGIGLSLWTGCVVPQPRGQGMYRHVEEPTTKAWYHLYLPVDYVRNNGRHPDPKVRRWPLVMTFHGMKPYDNALPQEREWEKEADVYGYIVCAPELATSDSFMQYPLTKEHGYVLKDKRNVIAIMDHVFATTLADPERVLSTSWSCGGYLAHYFPNRFPDRFSCIATRLSNFSHELMIGDTVPLYKDKTPVALFIGDGDFPACKTESENAVAWYTARKFRVVRGKMIDRMGHRRIPQCAAAFFAEQLGIEPLHPLEAAMTVAQVQMTDYYPPQDLIAKMSPRTMLAASGVETTRPERAFDKQSGRSLPPIIPERRVVYESTTAGRNYPFGRTPLYDPTPADDLAREMRQSSSLVPPTGAGATRVARATPSPPNWLEPTRNVARSSGSPGGESPPSTRATNSDSSGRFADAATKGRDNGHGEQSAGSVRSEPDGQSASTATASNLNTRDPGRRRPPVKGGGTDSPKDSTASRSVPAKASRPFDPRDAGPRDYDQLLAKVTPRRTDPPKNAARDPGVRRSARRGEPSVASEPLGSTVRRVNVRLSGPAIGTSPHYIAYGVDLPRNVLDGADCLWMDNGVWIGDDPSGVKILDAPGQHCITVLVVTKDNAEYRGSATVYVLEPRKPVGSSYRVSSE